MPGWQPSRAVDGAKLGLAATGPLADAEWRSLPDEIRALPLSRPHRERQPGVSGDGSPVAPRAAYVPDSRVEVTPTGCPRSAAPPAPVEACASPCAHDRVALQPRRHPSGWRGTAEQPVLVCENRHFDSKRYRCHPWLMIRQRAMPKALLWRVPMWSFLSGPHLHRLTILRDMVGKWPLIAAHLQVSPSESPACRSSHFGKCLIDNVVIQA